MPIIDLFRSGHATRCIGEARVSHDATPTNLQAVWSRAPLTGHLECRWRSAASVVTLPSVEPQAEAGFGAAVVVFTRRSVPSR